MWEVTALTEGERLQAGLLPLLLWYRQNRRELPWRSEPTPYHVWVSEIMLQQTRVSAVLGYYRRFMQALPTVEGLAACPEEQLLKLWQGLGYYSRARNLQRCAQLLCRERAGQLPDTVEELRRLPGIGEYTAGAIASIAFDRPVPAVDGNVLRVLTRLLADEGDIALPATRRRLAALLTELLPLYGSGELNQALMELGALVCLPNGAPGCARCPWGALCLAAQRGLTAQIPVKAPKRARRVEALDVFLICHGQKIALRRRPAQGLLARLWELPNLPAGAPLPEEWGLCPLAMEEGGRARHVFTHIEWHMQARVLKVADSALPPGWVWADAAALRERYAIPSAFSGFLPLAQRLCREEDEHAL